MSGNSAADDLIQIVDGNDRPVRGATKERVWAEGLWHRIVRIMVEDGRGNVLLQLRGPAMKSSPDKWDHAAAGHVDAGESYEQAAVRELMEETGIAIDADRLQEIGKYQSQRTDGARQLNRFNRVYRLLIAPDTPLKPQASEVTELRWFTLANAKKLVAEQPDCVTDGLKYVLANIYK